MLFFLALYAGMYMLLNLYMLRWHEVPIALAGVDDPAGRAMQVDCRPDEGAVLPPADSETFTILLKHRASVRPESVGRFDLQLSGHTHGGQVFPFHIYTRLYHPRLSGLHDLGQGSRLHVSRGVGTWGPPLRFLAPPDITCLVIVPDGIVSDR